MPPSAPQADRRLEDLPRDECLKRLAEQQVGRIAFTREDKIEIRPMSYRMLQGTVVLRTAYGTALDGLDGQDVVFEIDEADDRTGTGWSVIVHGTLEETWRPDELREIRTLGLFSWAPSPRDRILRIWPERITGRQIVT